MLLYVLVTAYNVGWVPDINTSDTVIVTDI